MGDLEEVHGTLGDLADAVDAIAELPGGPVPRPPGRLMDSRPIRTASYLITINPQVYYADPSMPTVHNQLLQTARALVRQMRQEAADGYVVSQFIRFRPAPGYVHYNHARDFVDVRPWVHNEIGPKFGRLHQHFVLIIRHRSNIQLNIPGIQQFYRNRLGRNVYVFVRSFRTLANVLDYINKNE